MGKLTAKWSSENSSQVDISTDAAFILKSGEGKRGPRKSFVLRYMRDGVERWMGLGPAYDVSLKKAREKARKPASSSARASTPSRHKREQKAKQKAAAPNRGTSFAAIADRYFP